MATFLGTEIEIASVKFPGRTRPADVVGRVHRPLAVNTPMPAYFSKKETKGWKRAVERFNEA
jgi:hypothetical protein